MMIAVEGIGLVRGTFALSRVSFVVPEESYTVLMGPSGAGKTLLLETIAGFYAIGEGTITVAGKDVTLEPPEKRGIGFVYQDYSLFPHLTVEENVSYGLRMTGVSSRGRKERAHSLLDQFGILPLAGRYPGTLSGGEKQRVALARALATNPAALLLDEPFAALDPDSRGSCMEEVKTIQREHGLTVLQVSHAREEAYLLADQVVVIDGGVILQAGPPAEVFSRPAHRTVASIAGYENVLEGTSRAVKGGKTLLVVGEGTVTADGTFPAENRYLVCIRAGDIRLTPPDMLSDHSETSMNLQVISCTSTDQGFRLRAGGPFLLTITIPRQQSPPDGYHPGDRLSARIAPGDVHLIPLSGERVSGGALS
jgi:ABC-type Fe3+/spermidine/putrescine transport system ATPase subunit